MYFFGSIAVLCAAFLLWRGYSREMDARLSICEVLLSLISDMRGKLSAYLISPREWALRYNGEAGELSPLLGALVSGELPRDAFSRVEEKLSFDKELLSIASELFSGLGTGYIESELRALDLAIEAIRLRSGKIKLDNERSKRAFGAVIGAAVGGVLILLA